MADFTVSVPDELLPGVNSARLAYNASLPATIPDPEDPDAQIPNPAILDTMQDYWSHVALRAAESYCRQYGHPVTGDPPPANPPQFEAFVEMVSDSAQWSSLINSIAATKPGAAQVLAGSLTVVSYGNYALFLKLWRRARLAGFITAGQVTAIQAVATTNNLPAAFISALNPA